MNENDDQKLLSLYQRSRTELPSELTDHRIRAAAKKGVKRKKLYWLSGLSTAAVLVLSFSLVMQLLQDDETIIDEITPAPMMQSAPMPQSGRLQMEQRANPQTAKPVSQSAPASVSSMAAEKSAAKEQKRSESGNQSLRSFAEPPQEAFSSGNKLQSADAAGLPDTAESDESALLLPVLPVTVAELQAIDPGLIVDQISGDMITVYSDNKLILTINKGSKANNFKAWSGSERLGIKLNWRIKPEQLGECVETAVYVECQFNDQVKAYFESQRLDFIEWQQLPP